MYFFNIIGKKKNMEIRYIWIEEFRGILENLDINFQHKGEHKFSYKGQLLQLIPNEHSILDFGNKINSITAIAGKNASGKSSICELIFHVAATYNNGGLSYYFPFKGIVCYGDRIFYSDKLEISNLEELEQQGYQMIAYENTPLEEIPFGQKTEFHKHGFIYYSNTLDWRTDISLNNLVNISTQFLIADDYRTGTDIIPDYNDDTKLPDFFQTHYDAEGYRSTKFYLDFAGKLPVTNPKKIILRNSYSGNNRYINYQRMLEYEKYQQSYFMETDILTSVLPYPYATNKGNDEIPLDEQRVKEAMLRLYRFNLMHIINSDKTELPKHELISRFVYEGEASTELFDDLALLKELLRVYEILVNRAVVRKSYRSYDLERSYLKGHQFMLMEFFELENTQINRFLLKRFLYKEVEFLRGREHYIKRITNYSLSPHQSSGEKAYYSFFSRLYDTIQRYDIGYDKRENLILFIDEGEGGFHPDWKKRFLGWVIDFLNSDFNKYNFQIIFTTHSPYLLSDLSSEHIILLDKKEGKTQIVPSNKFQTFGANIHELLSDAFFLTDGQIGEFARRNIQLIIDILNRWRVVKSNLEQGQEFVISEEQRMKCHGMITLIADDIVRQKLLEMYFELFDNQEVTDHEIRLLENRLRDLKNRKN
jgi:hypothetical protein